MDSKQIAELQRLASLHFDDDLDKEGVSLLSSLLESDAAAREAYVDLATANSDLLLLHDVVSPTTKNDSAQAVTSQTSDEFNAAGSPAYRWLTYGAVAIAASLLTAFTMPGLESAGSPESVEAESTEATPAIARIVRKVDCDWEGDRWAVVSTSDLNAGQTLTISRGLMELTFQSGACVTLEAPVSFRIVSAMRGELAYGKLTAEVPESAHGFTVSTPGGETVDLGTRFGVFVTEDGTTETHVFDGEVVVHSIQEDGDEDDTHLTTSMALRIGDDRVSPARMAAVPQRFTSIRRSGYGGHAQSLPVDRGLALWLSADQSVQLDESGRVVEWGDTLTESNTEQNNAWQVDQQKRPFLIEQEGGFPLVRFEGREHLVTEPLTLGDAKSVAAVFRPDMQRLRTMRVNSDTGRQLLNFNGPPHLVLGMNEQYRLVSRVYAGFRKTPKGRRDYRIAGKAVGPESLSGEQTVALYVYDPNNESSRLYIDGIMVDEVGARSFGPSTSPRYIGSHMFLPNTQFVGDISELLVYDTGLTNQEALRLSKSLMKKHRVGNVMDPEESGAPTTAD